MIQNFTYTAKRISVCTGPYCDSFLYARVEPMSD